MLEECANRAVPDLMADIAGSPANESRESICGDNSFRELCNVARLHRGDDFLESGVRAAALRSMLRLDRCPAECRVSDAGARLGLYIRERLTFAVDRNIS